VVTKVRSSKGISLTARLLRSKVFIIRIANVKYNVYPHPIERTVLAKEFVTGSYEINKAKASANQFDLNKRLARAYPTANRIIPFNGSVWIALGGSPVSRLIITSTDIPPILSDTLLADHWSVPPVDSKGWATR